MLRLSGLLCRAFGCSPQRSSLFSRFGHFDSNKLSGAWLVSCLFLTSALTGHNFKLVILFSLVGKLSYASVFQIEKEC